MLRGVEDLRAGLEEGPWLKDGGQEMAQNHTFFLPQMLPTHCPEH